ncbi:MAG: hypothetical protein AAGG46_09005, partial [Planctomycetota bacterium]
VVPSLKAWGKSASGFIYLAGHPTLDDDEKYGRIFGAYRQVAWQFLVLTARCIALVAATAGAFVGGGALACRLRGESVTAESLGALALDWPLLLGTLAPVAVLLALPKPPPNAGGSGSTGDYSAFDEALHYLFLGHNGLAKSQFAVECWVHKSKLEEAAPERNVYVAGLARSGSTSLMQYLGRAPGFKSLSYANLPLVMMPRTGPRLLRSGDGAAKERSHKDGVKHSLSSYEALEEPFWLHYAGRDYVLSDRLTRHEVDARLHAKYARFRALVAGPDTYLAKNNNFLLRAESVCRRDEESGYRTRTIIPFRRPLPQARSLLEQHRNLSELQNANPFALDYMDFLVHHEFGLHAKPQLLCGSLDKPIPDSPRGDVDHWLAVWNLFYAEALDRFADRPGYCFFSYDAYVRDPRGSLLSLAPFLELDSAVFEAMETRPWRPMSSVGDTPVSPDSAHLYERLTAKAINHA